MTGRSDRVARARWSVGPALLCASVLLTACSNPLDPGPADDIPPGCGECTDEIADLVATLEDASGVDAVTSTRRTTGGVSAAHLSLGLDLTGEDIVSTDVGAVVDSVAEAAWASDVSPLDVLTLDLTLRNGYTEGDGLFFGRDRAAYEQRWGRRPPGTEWTPLDQEDEGAGGSAAGCERDGCRELMREVARTVSDLPGVSAVTLSRFLFDDVTDADRVQVHVPSREQAADPAEVAGAVGEVVWRSEVAPLDYIEVQVDIAGIPETVTFQVGPDTGRDHNRLEQTWGPRPSDEAIRFSGPSP